MGPGKAFSGGLHSLSEAGGLNWRRQLHSPAGLPRRQKGSFEGRDSPCRGGMARPWAEVGGLYDELGTGGEKIRA